jgi:hypothetical protein
MVVVLEAISLNNLGYCQEGILVKCERINLSPWCSSSISFLVIHGLLNLSPSCGIFNLGVILWGFSLSSFSDLDDFLSMGRFWFLFLDMGQEPLRESVSKLLDTVINLM